MMMQVTLMIQVITILAALWLAQGCASKTTATYEISPDGKKISYVSSKEQQGLSLDLQEQDGKIKRVQIYVDKSTTQDAVQLKMMEVLQSLIPLLEKAALAGGS